MRTSRPIALLSLLTVLTFTSAQLSMDTALPEPTESSDPALPEPTESGAPGASEIEVEVDPTGSPTGGGGAAPSPTPTGSGTGSGTGSDQVYPAITAPDGLEWPVTSCYEACTPMLTTMNECAYNPIARNINSPCVCRPAVQQQEKACFECQLAAQPSAVDRVYFQALADRLAIQCANDDDPIRLERTIIVASGGGAGGTALPSGTGGAGAGSPSGPSRSSFPSGAPSAARSGFAAPSGSASASAVAGSGSGTTVPAARSGAATSTSTSQAGSGLGGVLVVLALVGWSRGLL